MNGIEVYKIYLALRTHFNLDRYDAVKYNYKTRCNPKTFELRRDRGFFNKLAKRFSDRDELVQYLLPTFIYQTVSWVGDLQEDQIETNHLEWLKYQESFDYLFKEECNKLLDSIESPKWFSELFSVPPDGSHPPIFRLYRQKKISVQTFIVLDKILNFIDKMLSKLGDDFILVESLRKVKKISVFLHPDTHKYKQMLKNILDSKLNQNATN